jgi:acetoin utilization protein AcuB
MLVRERMSRDPVTIAADASITDALRIMRQNQVRRLPVLDGEGKMVGIVSEKDLLYASPSPASSLSIYEMHYLLAQLKVTELMTADVVTVTPDTPLEEAARIMTDSQIGALVVVENDQRVGADADRLAGPTPRLVGIITETDIFRVFLELLGAREEGLRLTLQIPERKGEMARVTTAIAEQGGNILALGSFLGDDPTTSVVMVKVEDVPAEVLEKAMRDLGLEILDSRVI